MKCPVFEAKGFPPTWVFGNLPFFLKRICMAKPKNAMATSAIASNMMVINSILYFFRGYKNTHYKKILKIYALFTG
jgi:hypothetical protein